MREKSVHNPNTGSFWASSFLFSLVQELVPFWDPIKGGLDGMHIHKASCNHGIADNNRWDS